MPKDIRSFFTVLPKKAAHNTAAKATPAQKRAKPLDSSDDDVVDKTPNPISKKAGGKLKKRKVQTISSDSEGEISINKQKDIKKYDKVLKETLKPVNAEDVFGSTPVKQAKVQHVTKPLMPAVKESVSKNKKRKKLQTEVGIHDDPNFEKCLLELDDDLLLNTDELDKTIDAAVNRGAVIGGSTDKNQTPSKLKQNEITSPKVADDGASKTPSRKRKVSENEDTGIDKDQERYEKRRQSAALYQKYLNRSGPRHHGNKELPKGKPDCLKDLCFLRTGVLDSLEADEFDALVKEHGGRVVHAVSRKVNYVVAGDDPGPAKLAKAESYGIKTISEDELLDLVLTKSGMPARYNVNTEDISHTDGKEQNLSSRGESKIKDGKVDIKEKTKPSNESGDSTNKPNLKKLNNHSSSADTKTELKDEKSKLKEVKSKDFKRESKEMITGLKEDKKYAATKFKKKEGIPEITVKKQEHKSEHTKIVARKDLIPIDKHIVEIPNDNLAWTEKYKPTNVKAIIGQQGDKSNMKKLLSWLENWYKNHSGKNKPKLLKPSPWAKNDDGAYFKCALLSGPPGVGKTTTATLVAKELGFDVVEFNASDTRSKKLLHEEVSQLLSTTSIASFIKDGSAPSKRHVLLMDEVDGMAGNEDRGGVQELITLIKNADVPVICMCNDRNHPKIRSLANYCVDLRFARPRLEQIRGAMMSVCFKEGVNISPEALSQVINGAGMDIRQTLNHLSMWTADEKNLTVEVAQKEAKTAQKDTILGPWEVLRKVFSAEDHKTMTLSDKSKLFFYDYSIGPLFVQENYLQVVPHCSKSELLHRVADTADSLSTSVIIENKIRNLNNWSLLEVQGMYSSVLPGHYMEGHVGGQINFPGWLGKNSRRGKFQRLLSELQAHMRTSISASRTAVNLDYIYHLRDSIIRPLVKEGTGGVAKSLAVMHSYNLLREDFDSLVELAQWPRHKDPMAMVDSKVKAAFTRAYNKDGSKLPYAIPSTAVKKKTVPISQEDELYNDEEEIESSPEDDDDVNKDAMIKAKKKPAAKVKKDKEEATTSKKTTVKVKGKKTK